MRNSLKTAVSIWALCAALLSVFAGAAELAITIGGGQGLPIYAYKSRPTIGGTTSASPGSTVSVAIDGVANTTQVAEGGSWSLEWPADLEAGSYLVSATVTADGATASAEQDLRVDLEGKMPRQPLEPPPMKPAIPALPPNIEDFMAFTDRWQIVPPADYELQISPKGKWDPYNQNLLKGDRPFRGKDIFLSLTGISDTLVEARDLPTPSGVSSEEPGSFPFFGHGQQVVANQNIVITADLFKGLTVFRPADWRFRATLIGNINYANIRETGGLSTDVRRGSDRFDGYLGVQELFGEKKLKDLSENFDFVSVRVGIQPFVSDFRGFIYNDQNLGARLFGNWRENKFQYNLAFFDRLEKDTNSGLNKVTERRGQQVFIANLYKQDFLVHGYTTQFSVHYLHDQPSVHYDKNGFLVRPAPVGDFVPHTIDTTYLGWAGLGHFEEWNVDHAAYYVFGHDSRDPIAGFDPIGGGVGNDGVQPGGGSVDISAYMGAIEISRDYDWLRPRVAYFYASGDDNLFDRKANGFDAIFSNPNFMGGGFSFWNRMGIRLPGSSVGLTQRGSLLADLQSSKEEGQPEYVNPGVQIASIGLDVDVSPTLKAIFTTNYIQLNSTKVIQGLIFQGDIRKDMGTDISLGLRYRPYFSNNIVGLVGAAMFLPGSGWQDIYENKDTLYQLFTNLTLQW